MHAPDDRRGPLRLICPRFGPGVDPGSRLPVARQPAPPTWIASQVVGDH